jgi:hypothetical protein
MQPEAAHKLRARQAHQAVAPFVVGTHRERHLAWVTLRMRSLLPTRHRPEGGMSCRTEPTVKKESAFANF